MAELAAAAAADYVRAVRCWRANNLKSCVFICDQLSSRLQASLSANNNSSALLRLKHLVWFLKIRCLADDYYLNESLLLNEADVEPEDEVRVLATSRTSQLNSRLSTARNKSSIGTSSARRTNTAAAGASRRTAILTGRMASRLSRQNSSRAATSYRPLTTNLTASQAAFSRSTRLLLKYSTCPMLSKLAFEYLYNAQSVTSKCPDYRQCLEYLNLVQNGLRTKTKLLPFATDTSMRDKQEQLLSIGESNAEKPSLGVFWFISLGSCYFNLRMNKQAEENFLQAVAANPKHLDSYTWLVKVYLRFNQPAKVLRICQDGLAASKNQILYNWMARVQSLTGELYAANANLRESLKFHPTNIEALANVAHFNFYGDRIAQSLRCFERIRQLSMNQSANLDPDDFSTINFSSSSQLLNNLALCNFYSGNLDKVMPLFSRALLNSPSREVTSTIWYNISFVPLAAGFRNLAIACLRLALKNNSQNEEAINNLGVLKYRHIVNNQIHFPNKQELWGFDSKQANRESQLGDPEATNVESSSEIQDCQAKRRLFDDVESYFSQPSGGELDYETDLPEEKLGAQPETLYNMALVKKRRGQLLSCVNYCNLYLEHDPNNLHIKGMMKEIRQIVSHDG